MKNFFSRNNQQSSLRRYQQIGTIFISCISLLSACKVGPNYVKPDAPVPVTFKEARSKDWKIAQPKDLADRGEWWKLFRDPELNTLENKLNRNNQTVKNAEANYQQALALVDEARANYFPTLTGSASLTRQRQVSGSSNFTSTSTSGSVSSGSATTGSPNTGSNAHYSTTHSLVLNASWEPDIWGQYRRTVEASVAGAQSSAALLAATRLSAQGSLAQYYFELRALDTDQKLLNDVAKAYRKTLTMTKNEYASGTVSEADVLQAQSQLDSAQSLAINNHITRSQYEHAIAVLIGEPPANFSLPFHPLTEAPPNVPLMLPSDLLERRPDIAQAERAIAQANAQIGVDTAAYFPALTLSGSASVVGLNYSNWFSMPALGWSVGPQLAETILDGGLRSATIAAARATYQADVATYRQTVLAAFQDVEDNLVSQRLLKEQAVVQNRAAASAMKALKITLNQYQAGIVPFANVIIAETTAYNAQKSATDITGLRMTAAVGLIKALGGGWSAN